MKLSIGKRQAIERYMSNIDSARVGAYANLTVEGINRKVRLATHDKEGPRCSYLYSGEFKTDVTECFFSIVGTPLIPFIILYALAQHYANCNKLRHEIAYGRTIAQMRIRIEQNLQHEPLQNQQQIVDSHLATVNPPYLDTPPPYTDDRLALADAPPLDIDAPPPYPVSG